MINIVKPALAVAVGIAALSTNAFAVNYDGPSMDFSTCLLYTSDAADE